MGILLNTLGFIWQCPSFLIIWLGYVLPAWILGAITYHSSPRWLVWRFHVNEDKDNWYTRAWGKWGGWAGPSVVILKMSRARPTTLVHELRHTVQNFVFGFFKYPLYGLIFLFTGYKQNNFERDARGYAAQWARNCRIINGRNPIWRDVT